MDNEPLQIPNQYAADLIETSGADYTILRLGLLEFGDEDDFTITEKGEKVLTHRTTIESVEKVVLKIIAELELHSRKNISITRKAGA